MVVKTHASFRLFGDDLQPREVTRALGIEPDFAHHEGESRGRGRLWASGIWGISSEQHVPSADLGEHLLFLLDRLEPVRDDVKRMRSNFGARCDFFCFVVTNGQGGPVLVPATLGRVAAIDAELGLDIYLEAAD